MKNKKTVTVALTRDDLETLISGIDAHRYWNVADEEYRHDGFVRKPGSDYPEGRRVLKACDKLEARLETLRKTLLTEEPAK